MSDVGGRRPGCPLTVDLDAPCRIIGAQRSGSWWAVEVPVAGTTQYTQGRTLAETQRMAADVVHIRADELNDPDLATADVVLGVAGEPADAAASVREAQLAADEARKRARAAQVAAVAQMCAEGLTMADIATVMGLSTGRVSQLAAMT